VQSRIIIGIDPGSRKTGYGVVKICPEKLSYLTSGIIVLNSKVAILERLSEISQKCKALAEKWCPKELAIESLIHVKNISSLSKLAQARGAMIAAISPILQKGKIFEYSPTQIKAGITGRGGATKLEVAKGLGLMFGPINFGGDDESDALAIAVCHGMYSYQSMGIGGKT